MKYKAYIYIITKQRKLLKPLIIDKVIDKTHARKVINENYKRKRIRVLTIDKIY
jgi:hypothetical protein